MPFLEWIAKIGVRTKFSKFLSLLGLILSIITNLYLQLYFKT